MRPRPPLTRHFCLLAPAPHTCADSELRQERVGAFTATFAALAEAEEKEYLAAKKAAQLK